MHTSSPAPKPQTIHLATGAQAIINGAIVTANSECTFEVGSGGFVLTGRSLWRNRDPLRNPREELYFSMIDASTSKERFEEERFRLFMLLSQVVAQDRTHEAQKECALCASALLAGNAEEATKSASRLASERLGGTITARRRTPGQPGERRFRPAMPQPGRE